MKAGSQRLLLLSKDEPENGLRPSIAALFRSIARIYARNAIGVLLSGMGKDGAQELKLLKDLGAITIAQDRDSSVVHGMPDEAIKLGATTHVLPPEKIAPALANLASNRRRDL
jgi:two-component system, chemotaxis family, protein-glutamate methylesterase/glutaminase